MSLHEIFVLLLQRWAKHHGTTSVVPVAEWLGLPAHNITMWRYARQPVPLDIVLRLCGDLGLGVLFRGDFAIELVADPGPDVGKRRFLKVPASTQPEKTRKQPRSGDQDRAFALFDEGRTRAQVAAALGWRWERANHWWVQWQGERKHLLRLGRTVVEAM